MSELQELIGKMLNEPFFEDGLAADLAADGITTVEDAYVRGHVDALTAINSSDALKRLQSENAALREENEWLRALNDEYLENTPTGKKFCKVAWTSIEELVYAMQKLDDIENKKAEMFDLSKLILSKHNTTGDLVRLYISNSNGERVANEARKLTGEANG